ncbi:Gfo/Idh/MocA family protein [Spirosoma areae]
MDYTRQDLTFNIKKVIRYGQCYGPRRTLMKVRAHYHMRKVFPGYTPMPVPLESTGKHVGLLGCGKFAYANVAYYIRKNFGRVIRGVMDTDVNKAISLGQHYRADYYTTNAAELISDPHIDLIYIASNHASHADYAIAALKQGKAVHIEKPHAVDENQLRRLCRALIEYKGRVRLGFNRPESTLGLFLKQQLANQSGPAMLNWFVAGHAIEADHWYFAEAEGGRILGNLCHWIDFSLRLIPAPNRFPIQIIPIRSTKSDCDISVAYVFADGSIATITFSAKGHTFEGVRETMNLHKANLLATLTDFSKLRLDVHDKVIHKRLWFRDHGHERSIVSSYQLLTNSARQEPVELVWESGYLTLKTKEALETGTTIRVMGFQHSFFHPSGSSAVLP